MKSLAVFFTAPGKCELREWDCPDPAGDQIQVQCLANGICMGDTSLFDGRQHTHYPRAIGHEGVGVVTKVPAGVKGFAEGDYVNCFGWSSHQNLTAAHANRFARPPADPSVYIVEPAACVVSALYSYTITPGDRVLVLGAGYMGLLNVQGLARYPLGELVVADLKAANCELARAFGATEAVQIGTLAGDARLAALRDGQFDLVVEAAAAPAAIGAAGDFCRTGGRLSIFAWHHEPRELDLGVWHIKGLTVLNSAPGIGTDHNINSMARALTLLERGVFDMAPLITHRHRVEHVQEAMELSVARPGGYIKGVLLFD